MNGEGFKDEENSGEKRPHEEALTQVEEEAFTGKPHFGGATLTKY